MDTWESQAPEELRKWLSLLAKCQNAPAIGTDANYMWLSMQLNLAVPKFKTDRMSEFLY